MNRLLYPRDWKSIAVEIKAANDWQCQQCGKQCRRPGEFYLGWEYELSVAHICQDYEAEAVFVAALCKPCHFKHDAPLVWVARRRKDKARQLRAGQLRLNL